MKAVFLSLTIMAVLAHGRFSTDHCSGYSSCTTCIAEPLCGWCSSKVVYPTGATGSQCAGFNPNGTTPFQCNGIYSTEQCIAGYECDESSFQCKKTAPGKGVTKQSCEATCFNNGAVYLCNHTTFTCHEVPPGTIGSASLSVCDAECKNVTGSPSSASPVPTVAPKLYQCDYDTGKCVPTTPGHGGSKEVCEHICTNQSSSRYVCDFTTYTCSKVPSSQPGGEPKATCDAKCVKPHAVHGLPSSIKPGFYRGVEVSNGYKLGEVDLDITTTAVNLVKMYAGQPLVNITGLPYHTTGKQNLIINVTSGPDAGKLIHTLAFTAGLPGPETTFAAFAFGQAGGNPPFSIKSAWENPGQSVVAFAKCLSQDCVFTLPTAGSKKALVAQRPVRPTEDSVTDRCTAFGQSCPVCLSHKYCGWCSTNVTYQDGTKGSQCAGFNTANGSGKPFVCTGHYSTLKCHVGYTCDTKTYQCKMAPAGNGYPKAQCEALCVPTPPPSPPPAQYFCNSSLKQCFKCKTSSCPGSLPLGPCAAGCAHPKHGPHSALIGVWRGVYIQLGYSRGEVDIVFNTTAMQVYHDGKYQYSGNITSFGADALQVTILDGRSRGFTFGATYQFEGQDSEYEMMTYAKGKLGGGFPSSYNTAMKTPGMEVAVLAKCVGAPCKFNMLTP